MHDLARSWWSYSMRGVVAVFLGLLCLVTPGMSLVFFIAMLGSFWLLDSLIALFAAGAAIHEHDPWGWPVLEGVVSFVAAVALWTHAGLSALILTGFVGAWALVTGLLKMGAAVRLQNVIRHEWLLGMSGLLSMAFGLALLFRPGPTLLPLVGAVGVYAIVFGTLLIGLGFRMRHLTAGPSERPLAS